jgi:hypothetical protein
VVAVLVALVSGEGGLRRLSLDAIEFSRPWWRRHRYWLASPMPINGVGAIVINMRTGEVHDWRFHGNRRGRGWFGVRTRWALVHPNWKRDPWVLFYVPVDGAVFKLPPVPWWRVLWPW